MLYVMALWIASTRVLCTHPAAPPAQFTRMQSLSTDSMLASKSMNPTRGTSNFLLKPVNSSLAPSFGSASFCVLFSMQSCMWEDRAVSSLKLLRQLGQYSL